jgi:N-acetyl-gamma-glutamyl-phosphate reductase
MNSEEIRIAICGASGYTGSELLRILQKHPHARTAAVTSERSAGKHVSDLFPHLHGFDNVFEPLDKHALLDKADLFFMALPHGASQEAVDFFHSHGKKVIDLSADYRLKDPAVYKTWYKHAHAFPETIKRAVYGLVEINRDKIRVATLIANPGCYPTSVLLALYPAVKRGLVDTAHIVINSASGVSGAGRKAELYYSFCEIHDSFRAYAVSTHRHTPEIEQELSIIAKNETIVNFTPHLLPVNCGMLSTICVPLLKDISQNELLDVYREFYEKEPFVNVLQDGVFPDIRNVHGTNRFDLGLSVNKRTKSLILVSAIDNLVKGASGQAVQNMNLMCGFQETTALMDVAVLP